MLELLLLPIPKSGVPLPPRLTLILTTYLIRFQEPMYLTDSDRILIRSVIEQQLQAFLKDDAERAFAFATPAIQRLFDTPENLIRMVKISYPQVYRPRSVLFEPITTFQGMLTQPVLLLGSDGVPVRAMYWIEKQRNGSWGINGCYLLPIQPENRI